MDHIFSGESDFVVDLESCKSTSEEAQSTNFALDAKVGGIFFTSVCNGESEELSKAENGLKISCNIKDSDERSPGNVRVFIDKSSLVEKKTGKDKRKTMSAKKPPRPPRPPRGLSLDATDQKLIKEIAELAMIKRARIERMKALAKMNAAKASSASSTSNGSFLALLFTVFFFFVLLFQGISYRSSAMSSHDSLQSGGVTENRFVIVQDYSNLSSITAISAESGSSNLVDDSPKRVTS